MNSNRHITNSIVWSFLDSEETVFSRIYEKNLWNSEESVSGMGSELVFTKNIRNELPKLFQKLSVQTLIDAPCGDYNWMRYVHYPLKKYVGIDIVDALIKNNIENFANENIHFFTGNIAEFKLPKFDMILCRDCFIHLKNDEILRVLKNFKNSKSKYLLATNFPEQKENIDVITGQFRMINLLLPPFSFPPPVEVIEEDELKKLFLWELKDISL